MALVITQVSHERSGAALMRLEQRAVSTTGIQTVLRRLLDAQTGLRGYLLSGRAIYLEPYVQAASDATAGLNELAVHYADDAAARAMLADLHHAATDMLNDLAATLQAVESGRPLAWAKRLDDPAVRRRMDQVRGLAEQLVRHEQAQAAWAQQTAFETLRVTRIGVGATAALGVLALLMLLQQTAAFEAVRRRHSQLLQDEQQRLETEVAQRTEDLRELARHLHRVQEDEVARLAHDLHQDLGSLLAEARRLTLRLRHKHVPLPPEAQAHLDRLDKSLAEVMALKRRIVNHLFPCVLSQRGLVAALETQLRDFGARAGVTVSTTLQDIPLSPAAQMAAYRLVQESLNNISKYAAAERVHLTLRSVNGVAVLGVADDGQGFDPGLAPRRGAHGLQGMRYRVEAVGGRLHIRAAPGQGSCIEAQLPLCSSGQAPARAAVWTLNEAGDRPDRALRPRYRPSASPPAAIGQTADAVPAAAAPRAQPSPPVFPALWRRA